ncbi:MAG: leucine--tRNA ligase [Planctomycetes bacterium]|nr:leucine--tRNA ligase [Planctomycetota bacterium]
MNDPRPYEPASIETKWQQTWEAAKAYKVRDDLPREKCYYVLEMFPYPSGKLHMGHVRNYSIGDAVARYKRMRGLHVLHPMGWDSFGLPAEQAAIERGAHPAKWTYENIAYMRGQLKRMGFSYDWTREFACSDPGYAAREQDIFIDLVEKGLVYRKSSLVNWSTGLNCVLANEQVVDGKCWRTGMPVVQKELPQWYLRITSYADELLAQLDALKGSWPDAVLTQQRNWLGRSEGAEIDFAVDGHPEAKITVFTTRPDTVFGVTFMSIAPEHRLVDAIVPASHRAAVEAFRAEVRAVSAQERMGDTAEKKGVFTGAYAVNPVNGRKVPIYAANFVVADYGTGAVMAVPAHDTRDFAFARKYGIDIITVIQATDAKHPEWMKLQAGEDAYTEAGVLTASAQFDGRPSEDAKREITAWLESTGKGRKVVTWRLRDWCLSRQRYWGNPIPYAYTDKLGAVPLRKQDLPVTLPQDVVFDGKGNPIERHPTWAVTAKDGSPLTVRGQDGPEAARRETDTMDTFMESSWYFARYTCHDNTAADLGCAAPLDRKRVDHWLPVDLYIGGIEHAVMHLLYARFFQKALCDVGYSAKREPFKRLLCQGMVCMETLFREKPGEKKQYFYPDEVDVERDAKGRVITAVAKSDGQPVQIGRVEKMSKSKRNTVDPQALIEQYGADSARLFVLSNVPPELDVVWSEDGIRGSHRYLKRLWVLVTDNAERLRGVAPYSGKAAEVAGADQAVVRKVHAVIKRCTDALEKDFAFNTAVAQCMELTNELKPDALRPDVLKLGLSTLVRLIAPMSPHIAEELWELLGGTGGVTAAGWPAFDESEIAGDSVEYPVQANGKVRGKIVLSRSLAGKDLEAAVLASDVVKAATEGKTIKKLVIVPGKIINLVVG